VILSGPGRGVRKKKRMKAIERSHLQVHALSHQPWSFQTPARCGGVTSNKQQRVTSPAVYGTKFWFGLDTRFLHGDVTEALIFDRDACIRAALPLDHHYVLRPDRSTFPPAGCTVVVSWRARTTTYACRLARPKLGRRRTGIKIDGSTGLTNREWKGETTGGTAWGCCWCWSSCCCCDPLFSLSRDGQGVVGTSIDRSGATS